MSSTTSYDNLNSTLLSQLECPVCFTYCQPPISMCINGHNICSDCVPRLNKCPVCKGPKPSVRNLFAEETSRKVTLRCKNFDLGCESRCTLHQLETHQLECPYQYYCRVWAMGESAKCLWKGDTANKLANHVKTRHSSCFYEGNVVKINHKFSFFMQNNNPKCFTHTNPVLFSSLSELFWVYLHFVPEKRSIYPYARYVGPDHKATKFISKFIFTTTKDIERKMIYQSRCIGWNDFTKTVFDISLPVIIEDIVAQCCATNCEVTCDLKMKLKN